ncbi:agmatinase [candidate division WOR-3 bacterium]|nr:agmatinase [candidate division WOR-3 bacterium]
MQQVNFGGLDPEFSSRENSKFVILPVPFDLTSSWLKGSDKGPAALIEASANMELFDEETEKEPFKAGIFTEEPVSAGSTSEMVEKVKKKITEHLKQGKIPVTIGGEHSVSIGAFKAFAEFYDRISVLHLDAHSDRRDVYEGDKFNHACVISRAEEIGFNVVSAGIRSLDFSEKRILSDDRVFLASKLRDDRNWIKKVMSKLSENVYVTIDLDVFDPCVLPSTGTPEPGGLSWYEVLDILRETARNKKIRGFDVVELKPDHNRYSDFTAAKLVYKLIGYING